MADLSPNGSESRIESTDKPTQDLITKGLNDSSQPETKRLVPENVSLDDFKKDLPRYILSGGSLEELVQISTNFKNAEIRAFIVSEHEQQLEAIAKYLELFHQTDPTRPESPESITSREQTIAQALYDYAARFYETRSLRASIPSEFVADHDRITKEFIDKKEHENLQFTQAIRNEIIAIQSETDSAEPTPQPDLETVDTDQMSVDKTANPPSLTVKQKDLPDIVINIRDQMLDVLPALLVVDGALAFAKGESPRLMMIINEARDTLGTAPTNELLVETILGSEALSILQKNGAGEIFFKLFQGKENKLWQFIERITPSSGNMYCLLEKLPLSDVRFIVEGKPRAFPGGLRLGFSDKEESDHLEMILTRLSAYDRRRLGIHPTEPRMM